MNKYHKEYGSYYFKDDRDNIIFMCDEVSVLYDSAEGVLLKHGRPENVDKHFKEYLKLLGSDPNFNLKVITSNKWNVSELNKILDTSGYVKLVEKYPNRFVE